MAKDNTGRFGIEVIAGGQLIDGRVIGGRVLPEIVHQGKTYIAAPDATNFALRFITPYGERFEVVASVDGLSIMNGKDATPDERGYVVSDGGATIGGYRLNDAEVAKFRFGTRQDSYAAKLGKPRNVGVIAAKFFSEYRPSPVYRSTPRGGCLGDDTRSGGFSFGGGGMKGLGGLESLGGGLKGGGHDMGVHFGDRSEQRVGSTIFTRNVEVATVVIEFASEASLRARGIIAAAPLGEVDPFPGERKITGCQPPAGWTGRR